MRKGLGVIMFQYDYIREEEHHHHRKIHTVLSSLKPTRRKIKIDMNQERGKKT